MTKFLVSLLYLLTFLLCIVFSGFVTTELWLWFAVPLGAPVIGIAHALGLRMLVTVATHTYSKDERSQGERLTMAFVFPLFAWGFGAVYQSFLS